LFEKRDTVQKVEKILVKFLKGISVWSVVKNANGDIEIRDYIVKSECYMAKIAGVLFKPSDIVVTDREGNIVLVVEVDGDKHNIACAGGEVITGKTATRNAVLREASQGKLVVIDVREIERFNSDPAAVLVEREVWLDISAAKIPQVEIYAVVDEVRHEEVVADVEISVAASSAEKKEVVEFVSDESASRPVSVFAAVRKSGKKSKHKQVKKKAIVSSEPVVSNSSLLFQMVRDMDSEGVENFLYNLSPSERSSILFEKTLEAKGDTFLAIAMRNNDLETALVLVERGAIVQKSDQEIIESVSDEMMMLIRSFIPKNFILIVSRDIFLK
jgi:hypothetical protein